MRDKIKTPKEVEKEIEKVSSDDIQKLAKQIFIDKNLNMAIVGNIKDEKGLSRILHF